MFFQVDCWKFFGRGLVDRAVNTKSRGFFAYSSFDSPFYDPIGQRIRLQAAGRRPDLNDKINAIAKQIRENAQCVKLNEEIRACDQRRGKIDGEIRESAKLKPISAKIEAASAAKVKAEEARLAARKVMDDARKRIAEAKSAEAANFDARIQKFN